MYSVNAPVPPAVNEIAADLRPALTEFDRVRQRHEQTLLVKRVPANTRKEALAAWQTAQDALQGAPAAQARISEIDTFQNPPNGSSPVVYLAVESPGIHHLHDRLCDPFDPVPVMEGGDDYDPHVTLARDADGFRGQRAVDAIDGRAVGPVTWTIDELSLYDATVGEPVDTVSLPA
ncbi:2'-5' RNA ligase family protein [Halobacterium salinarum]|uniref:2'-5' RNA ligase family protein n=1 Tax=Halobacterium salinarum TaxID=2242 RepID=UPI001F3358EB|nr:2'-5' RNA ligase family protein [Halobacterium salinarum]MCF2208213.1 2'-5' RNA ligase family protein [Halobacterium salinarum]